MNERPFTQVIELLHNAGLRPTKQRMALARLLFDEGNRHVTAEDLYREAKKAKIPLSLATVYNTLHQFKGEFINGDNLSGEFRANLNKRAPFGGEVLPSNGNIRIEAGSNDAGQFLMALDVLERAQGGRLLLTLDQRDTAGEMDGVVRVTDIKLQKMPILAELLNAISIVGLLDQLTGPGVIMNEIDATFRLTNDQIIVQSASAIGPSMGITLDGYYNLETKTFDMQGFFSPLYLVNGIGSILSRKGQGFIGFGFNLRGTTDRPRFIINPLSAITPSILRDLFRRPPPKLE